MNLKLLRSTYFVLLLLVIAACSSSEDDRTLNPKLDKLKLQTGFKAEHLLCPSDSGMGSWVSMAFDNKGRLITSDQYGTLYRMEIPAIGSESLTPKVEKLKIQTGEAVPDSVIQMGFAQGLLWAFNSLYVMVNTRNDVIENGSGLYRLQDTDNDDQFDKITLLKALKGWGEHGPHAIVLAPDGNSLYVISGNHTDAPDMDAYRNPKVWQNDNLFPLYKDPRGHASTREAPGGWIAKTDSLGEHWELISSGFRNAYDFTFNDAGDLFTYDADMEWDMGMPWYRPTRICHVTSGSEFGWRTGNGKWSSSYPDNLPPVLNIGQGSPTGMLNGQDSGYPDRYQKALFAFDWSFGIIYAIHLKPDGSTYSAEKEEFLSGIPLPLTDGVFGPDGAMYFATGGRRLNSDLYRVYFDDGANNKSVIEKSGQDQTELNLLRRKIEEYHDGPMEGAVDFVWPHLASSDRFIQYAARIALEHQPVDQWMTRVYNESDDDIVIQGIIALIRHSGKTQQQAILNKLMTINYSDLNAAQQLNLLRAFELCLYRHGIPGRGLQTDVINYLEPHFPAEGNELNRMLSKILVYLESPSAIEKTVVLLETPVEENSEMTNSATDASDLINRNLQYGLHIARTLSNIPPEQHTYYAMVLSQVKTGWTPELRERYFSWYREAFNFSGGMSYIGFINNARKAALSYVPKEKFDYYNALSGDSLVNSTGVELAEVFQPKGPGKRWKEEDISSILEGGLAERNFVQGKNMYTATTCALCHSMNGIGGTSGPDLSALGTRFSPEDILSSIINPSKVISDQFASVILDMKEGPSVVGRIIDENDQSYMISQNPFAPDVIKEIPKSEVASYKLSEVSPMPPGMINRLNEEEIKDLLAYLISGGQREHLVYQ